MVCFKLQEQERLVWNRSIWFWKQLNDGNRGDAVRLFDSLRRLTDNVNLEHHVFPQATAQFESHVTNAPHHKRAFITLHQMLKFLKNYIYLVRTFIKNIALIF